MNDSHRGQLRPPVDVALARAVAGVPGETALPGGVLYEQKWDGYRMVAFGGVGGGVSLQSRR